MILVNGSPKKVEKKYLSHQNVCTLGFCTGDRIIFLRTETYRNMTYEYFDEGKVIGGSYEDDVLIEFLLKGKKTYAYKGADSDRFYKVGCSGNICVKDYVYVINKEYKSAKVVGLDGEGTLVLLIEFHNGAMNVVKVTNEDVIKL